FNDFFGTRLLRSVKAGEIEVWLHGLALGPQTINNYRAVVRAFFTFAVKRKHLDANPVSAIDKVRLIGKAPEIFTPEVLAKVLAAAPRSLLPSLAIGAFAGLRTSELLRLNWSNVDLVRGFVHVQADRPKSARRRLVRITPNLMEWLRPF